MANTYGTIVTDAGIATLADATAAGTSVPISTCAVGDGGGAYYQPESTQTTLVGLKWQGNLAGVRTNAENAQILEIEIVVPSSAGGFTIREMGVFLNDGTLFAVANTPDIQKTALASGAANETKLVMYIQVVSTASVEFTLDPNVVVATKGDIAEHDADVQAHAGHFVDAVKHITPAERASWNGAKEKADSINAASAVPQSLGTAAVGNSANYARENHVHKLPTTTDLGLFKTLLTVSGDGWQTGDRTVAGISQYNLIGVIAKTVGVNNDIALVAARGMYGNFAASLVSSGIQITVQLSLNGDTAHPEAASGRPASIFDVMTGAEITSGAKFGVTKIIGIC
ncbi:MAG: phage tail protein [Oscillospiraceae bacterium]|jgi:hypothetical protein|nr:phage tail protein [Oscillospiraceae bacterium]